VQTLSKQLKANSLASTEAELHEFLDGEYRTALSKGDLLGAGEWLVSTLDYECHIPTEEAVARTLALWSSPSELPAFPSTIKELVDELPLFASVNMAKAVVALSVRKTKHFSADVLLRDIIYKLQVDISSAFSVKGDRPSEVFKQACAKLDQSLADCRQAILSFSASNCSSARTVAVELLRQFRNLRPLVLRREHAILGIAEGLLGGGFREFTSSYEKGEMARAIRQIADIRQQASEVLASPGMQNALLWNILIRPVADHLLSLCIEANRTSRGAITPSVRLTSRVYKADLRSQSESLKITARLINTGVGIASGISLVSDDEALSLDNAEQTELQPGADRLVTLTIRPSGSSASRNIRLEWHCRDVLDEAYAFEEEIEISQQMTQPDWGQLLETPPYSINPIRKRSSLYGREAQLSKLLLWAAGSTSVFLWGQKRVGKTSLLQVLQDELSNRPRYRCAYIRMGEVIGMHEGQFAHLIASRIVQGMPLPMPIAVPAESEFGAGAGRLVPFVEGLIAALPGWHFLVIIDEFDDLDPSFYTGERGRIFVKALRSLSEIGLTFFFAGSERMSNIYQRHALELNKWHDMYLDSIDSPHDCHELIVKPVEQHIEYEGACVSEIIQYCNKHPFFLHLCCSGLFENCLAERRTYVGEADAQVGRAAIISGLGPTNFAHLWADNPTLDREENRQFTAENCLVLACVALIGGPCDAELIIEKFEALGVQPHERLSPRAVNVVLERLRSRKVLVNCQDGRHVQINFPIFRDWLSANADLSLMPIWSAYSNGRSRVEPNEVVNSFTAEMNTESSFIISEDHLLSVSSNLVYLGKQKDVAEIRSWLRQFDDDTRIEIAFLLLKRLAENGYTSTGARDFYLSRMVDTVSAFRQSLGSKVWNIQRGRLDNLCISYVDSETKSGATTARELIKRLRPGQSGDAETVSNWLRTRANSDPILVLSTTLLEQEKPSRVDFRSGRSIAKKPRFMSR